LQLRVENIDFDLSNNILDQDSVTPGRQSVGAVFFNDQSYSSQNLTLSGSVGYSIPFPNNEGLIFATSGGFSISRADVDDILVGIDEDADGVFDTGAGDSQGVVEIDDIVTTVGFASATLAKTRIAPSGTSALRYFGTVTYYADFTSDTDVTLFTSLANQASGTNPFTSTASSLGNYAELSLGLNYTKIIDPGQAGALRQFDASVRLDGRASSDINSVALTAQARLQF
jgi:hypothetical protein